MVPPIDRAKYMNEQEVKQLVSAAELWSLKDLKEGRKQGVVAWALVDVALRTGLRVSEIAKLTIGDFKAKQDALRVWRHKRKELKQETLAIPPELTKHLAEFIEWNGTVGHATGKESPIFEGQRGPLSAQGLQQIWKTAIERAGLPRELSIHSARHTMAVHLLRKTKNLRQVQKQLGHANPATTANMYADISFEDMKAGVTGLYGSDDGKKA